MNVWLYRDVKKIKTFALIGTGFIMPRHADAIHAIGGEILDVVNAAHGENAWRKMIKKTKADCVVVLAPNYLHVPMCVAARKSGKIVLAEKPLSLTSRDARKLAKLGNIFTVMQLRHHPMIVELKKSLDLHIRHNIVMDIAVYRDAAYDRGWKGQSKKSGGILFNLGIHYFDIVQYLFGMPTAYTDTTIGAKEARGVLEGKNYRVEWHLATNESQKTQRRLFVIDEKEYNLSSKDNLSYENLHRTIYQNLITEKGIMPKDALPSIELIEHVIATRKAS